VTVATRQTGDVSESLVERQIREARERGDFDDLPGRGQPLDLSDTDELWWVRRKLAVEGLDLYHPDARIWDERQK
jgi:hypothetical protein